MSECVFCRICAGQVSAHTVYEDDATLAFLDVNPLTEGHTLVIPRRHYETLVEMPVEDVERFFRAVRIVTERVERGLKVAGTTIGINNGRQAGQVVPHLHLHIVPRYAGDRGGTIHSVVHMPPRRPLEEVRTLVAAAAPRERG